MSNVVTRFPPSPTGKLHIGNARTAIFNYLFAKHHEGTMYFRFEDTDLVRSKKEYEDEILKSIQWLGLEYELPDGPYRQTERLIIYQKFLKDLMDRGVAYEAEESENDPGRKVIRFKNPNAVIAFDDLVRGKVTVDTTDLKDFVIARSIDQPLYHLAVVVDDNETGVTHVIRGEDHISNTPRQILLLEALGFTRPIYAHLPLILATDRSKFSKRHGATNVSEYIDKGYLPEAMLNYLAFLGWHPEDDNEYLSRKELIEQFDIGRVQKGGAVFDETKLLSVNQHWMRKLSDADFLAQLETRFDLGNLALRSNLVSAIPLLKERARTFGEAKSMLEGELKCLFEEPKLSREQLVLKEPVDRPGLTKTALESLLEPLKALPKDVSSEAVKDTLMPLADAEEAKGKGGRGALLWPLRYALSGQERSPDPFTLVSTLGPKEALSRVEKAIAILEG